MSSRPQPGAAPSPPAPADDRDAARADLDPHGYCRLAGAMSPARLDAVRARLDEQARAEREAGIAYLDGAAHQNRGRFRDASGRVRGDAFTAAAGGVNQRLWMLVNKGRVFRDLLALAPVRALVDPGPELVGELR